MELCKLFLQYLHTESNMRLFTKETGVFKPFNYTLTDDDYNALFERTQHYVVNYKLPELTKALNENISFSIILLFQQYSSNY